MFHVFEHIKDPLIFLDKCKKILKPNGLIIIEVPHSEDPLIKLYNNKQYKDFVFQPMHPMIYNKQSLDFVFNSKGFLSVSVNYYQRYGLDNHLSWILNDKKHYEPVFTKLFNGISSYKKILEANRITDTIFYVSKAV